MSVALERASPRAFWLLVTQLRTAALDLIFPPRCVGCGRVGRLFCAACQEQMHAAHPIRLEAPGLHAIAVAAIFGGPWRNAIHALKYEAQRAIAPTLAAFLPALDADPAPDLVIPVPLHPNRQRWRDYNQSALLAQALAARLGVEMNTGALRRVRDTRAQVGLNARLRRLNVKDAFAADPGLVSGRRILLVDDVVTTGATLSACADALRAAGAEGVCAVALACAPPVRDRLTFIR